MVRTRRAQQASAKAAVYTPKKSARPPPAPTRSDDGWEWWKESQPVRPQPAAAAASNGKWNWSDETQKEQTSSDTSWSMVGTPQDHEDVAMPDSKKHKPPDGAVRMSLEAPPLDTKPPSGGGMTCAHAPSASTAAGAMSSLAATGYSTPEAADDAALDQDPEPPEAEGKYEGGRTVSGNLTCECCGECGLWGQFAFAELGGSSNGRRRTCTTRSCRRW
eukprot:75296-Amphidinium_carterae.1